MRPANSGSPGISTAPATYTSGRPIARKRSKRPSLERALSSILRGRCRAGVSHSHPVMPQKRPSVVDHRRRRCWYGQTDPALARLV